MAATVESCVSRDFGVRSPWEKVVEGEFGLLVQLIPEVQRELRVHGAQSGDEMVLPGADAAFGTEGTMVARGYKL